MPLANLNSVSLIALLYRWLLVQIPTEGISWLDDKRKQIAGAGRTSIFFTAFSAVPRYVGKKDLQLTLKDWQAAEAICPGWLPAYWSVDQVARSLLVLSLPQNEAQYQQTLEQLFSAADVGELIALYQALPLLPYPEKFRLRAAEGVRSNMTTVFNAVAVHNPYPAQHFDDSAWNQMVLKALFVGSPLHLIQGLDRRANPQLAQMLTHYAHERWAANRSVSPELWRAIGQHANAAILADLERVLAHPEPTQKAAAALACAQCPLPQAQALLERYPDLKAAVASGHLTWSSLIETDKEGNN